MITKPELITFFLLLLLFTACRSTRDSSIQADEAIVTADTATLTAGRATLTTGDVFLIEDPRFRKADAPAFYKQDTGTQGMVVTAHPLASEAGRSMLRAGGNAVDAAVAAAFAVAVLEPNMSGLGGSGAMTLWIRERQQADYVDFYAATGADPDYARDSVPDSLISRERGVAVPGMVAGLLEALEKYGTLDRQTVMEPAIQLAEEGFIVHHLLAYVIDNYGDRLTYDPDSAELFYPDDNPLRAGQQLIQSDLAGVLRRIAAEGRDGFYSGEIAERAIAMLNEGGSPLTPEDFENYRPRWRGALCEEWHGHRILTAPPSLAGHEVILALKLLEHKNLTVLGHPISSGESLVAITDALRIARADRSRWDGDPDFVDLPVAGLFTEEYLNRRRKMMGIALPDSRSVPDPGTTPDSGTVSDSQARPISLTVSESVMVPDSLEAGDPWQDTASYTAPAACTGDGYFELSTGISRPDDTELLKHVPEEFRHLYETEQPHIEHPHNDDNPDNPEQHTTHIAVVDRNGNAVSMTNTLGLYFGSGVYSDGVFYNSAAGNFGGSYGSIRGPERSANSSTAPTLVLTGDRVALVTGSPGSGRIPPAIVNTIIHTMIYELHPADAVRMPRIYPMIENRRVELERGFAPNALKSLHERGYVVDPSNYPMNMYFGGVQMIRALDDGTLIGVSDPRRDGGAAGY